MSGFDEKCPLCGTNQGDLRAAWEAKEYPGEFQCQCDKCDRWFNVVVHQVPEFETEELRCMKCHKHTRGFDKHYCTKCEREIAAYDNPSEFDIRGGA